MRKSESTDYTATEKTMAQANVHRRCPYLWQETKADKLTTTERKEETVDDLIQRFSSTPHPRSLWILIRGSLAVGQEFALTCLLLARHRIAMKHEQDRDQWRHVTSIVLVPLTLLAIFYSERTASARGKFRTRVCDALLLAGILRLLSSVLRTLTASYSSDTVYALAITGMLVHVLACDYRYANGHMRKNAAFAGGVMSLNASLFSTTLLASRLSSNATVYVFVSTSVILFAFYPAARHTIAVTQPHAPHGTWNPKTSRIGHPLDTTRSRASQFF